MKSLKLILIVAICQMFFQQYSFAISNTMSQCLGKEEYFIYKNKISGPIYRLNQEMISHFSKIPDIILPYDFSNTICGKINKRNSPSLKILEYILANKKENILKVSSSQFIILFFKFIEMIQTISPGPQCLNKFIPYLKKYKDYVRYTGSDLKFGQVDLNKNEYHQLFDQLRNIDQVLKRCQQSKKKRKRKRKLKVNKNSKS